MSNDRKINFLYKSIEDTQSTIRAVDIKAGFLFIIVFLPITALHKLFAIASTLQPVSPIYSILIIATSVLWILSIYTLFKTVISISNPEQHIKNSKPNGSFYSPNIFSFSTIDTFFNFPIKSNIDLIEYGELLPNEETEFIRELSFEKMKLTYIRDIKIRRVTFCSKTTFYWIIMAGVIWILYLLKIGF